MGPTNMIQVIDSIPWVRCASGNVCMMDSLSKSRAPTLLAMWKICDCVGGSSMNSVRSMDSHYHHHSHPHPHRHRHRHRHCHCHPHHDGLVMPVMEAFSWTLSGVWMIFFVWMMDVSGCQFIYLSLCRKPLETLHRPPPLLISRNWNSWGNCKKEEKKQKGIQNIERKPLETLHRPLPLLISHNWGSQGNPMIPGKNTQRNQDEIHKETRKKYIKKPGRIT